MDTFAFQTRLEILLGYKSRLPLADGSAAPGFTDLEEREIVLKTYPATWIANFDNSGQRASSSTLATIRQYMVTQHANELMDKATQKKRKSDSRRGPDPKRRGSYGGYGYSPFRGGGRGYGGRGRGYEGRGGRGRGYGSYDGRGRGRFGGGAYRGRYRGGYQGRGPNQWQNRSQYGGDQSQYGGGRGDQGNYYNDSNNNNQSVPDGRQHPSGGYQRGHGNYYNDQNDQQQGRNGPTGNRY